ncbi:MAG TPA: hypothetical protein GXX36_14800 [Clostridiaceae bacterium]|nr:hypothetical protein [Clostridiaceae bacterium]
MSIFYDFVEFLGPAKSFNEQGNLSGKMVLNIKTLTPLFIASGYEDRDGKVLFRCFERFGSTPVIPGSSLKGVLRTISQAVSYSCVEVDRKIKKDLPFQYFDCSCIVCSTFGKMGKKAKVRVEDQKLVQGQMEIIRIPIQMGPNVNIRQIYYKNGKLKGIKFYRHGDYRIIEKAKIPVEAVKEGAIFEGELFFEDLHQKQLELLCYSLGLDNSFQLKIGNNKSGFFGSCKVEVKKAMLNGSVFRPEEYAKNYGKGDRKIENNKNKLSEILDFRNMVKSL